MSSVELGASILPLVEALFYFVLARPRDIDSSPPIVRGC